MSPIEDIASYDSDRVRRPLVREAVDLIQYRDLLSQMVVNIAKARYKRSILGVAWTLMNPVLHTAAFTYASDLTLLGATVVPHGVTIGSPQLMPASLDHTIWFHRPFRADRWWLYDQWSPSAQGGRGLSLARVFTEDGTLVATVAQEGLIRRRDR